jgi:hypothetical protein
MFKSKVTPAIAVTALVVALFGATPLGQAASRLVLPKNSIGAAQIKKSAVSGNKVAKNAITGAKVKNGSLMAADFKPGQLPAGPAGTKGDTGATGSPGVSGLEFVENAETNDHVNKTVSAYCPGDKRAIAVAGNASGLPFKAHLYSSGVANQTINGNAVHVGWVSADTDGQSWGSWTLSVQVTCVNVQ